MLLQWSFLSMSGHALVRSWCFGEKPATSFLPSHAPQEVFSDWLADEKPSTHQEVNLAPALSANYVAVTKSVCVRTSKSLSDRHEVTEGGIWTGYKMHYLFSPIAHNMQENSRPYFVKCPCTAVCPSSLQSHCYVVLLVPLDLRRQCAVNRRVIVWSHFKK